MRLAVASGKGGTGKTLVATNLAVVARRAGQRVTLVDCDVEAPNDHLFFDAEFCSEAVEVAVPAEPPAGVCPPGCALCRDACRFGAIRMLGGGPVVFPDLCHACGVCIDVCPARVLEERQVRVGQVRVGTTRDGVRLVMGQLDVGQTKAPTVIWAARARAGAENADVTILDAPPGVACSAVATLHGVDLPVLVTDPTAFGIHDLRLMVQLSRDLGVTPVVVLNREGAGAVDVAGYCRSESIPLVGRLPFDRRVAECYADGGLLVDEHPAGRRWFEDLWTAVREHLATTGVAVPA